MFLSKGDALLTLIITENVPAVAPDGVVPDAGGLQQSQHLRPDLIVTALVFSLHTRFDAALPRKTFHK